MNMNKFYPFEELRNLIEQNQNVIIFLAKNPMFDQVASALALKLALEEKGKSCDVICSTPMKVEFSDLVGIDTINQKNQSAEGKDLVVSLNYPLEQIEKVSYNDEGGKLNLLVQVKEGASRVEKEQIRFSYQGGKNGFQVFVGIDDVSKLDQSENFPKENLVNIDNSSANSRYGKINIVDPEASSCSQMVVAIISNLGLPFNLDIGGNLYLGIKNATENFSSERVNAETFEAAAFCLKSGAKNASSIKPTPKPIFEETPKPFPKTQLSPNDSSSKPFRSSSAPSPDWLEPKIFRSSNI